MSFATQSKTSEFLEVPLVDIIPVTWTNPNILVFLCGSSPLLPGAPKELLSFFSGSRPQWSHYFSSFYLETNETRFYFMAKKHTKPLTKKIKQGNFIGFKPYESTKPQAQEG